MMEVEILADKDCRECKGEGMVLNGRPDGDCEWDLCWCINSKSNEECDELLRNAGALK